MTSGVPVPLVDLGIQRDRIADEVAEGFAHVLARTAFVLGREVDDFEREYAEFSGVDHCVGVGNGTDALELALRGVGIGEGDEVVLPANTFFASAEGVLRAGANPVLVDCDGDHLVDIERALAAVTERTRAVLAVHLYGRLVDVPRLQSALPEGVLVVEDAAQSQGAALPEGRSGSLGVAAATSFYPGKNLGAYGDAGAVTTPDPAVADMVRALRNHGGTTKYEHRMVGTNSRLDTLQAVVLRAKLHHLEAWNEQRRVAAETYDALLDGCEAVQRPRLPADRDSHVWHLYVVEVQGRDDIAKQLNADGIGVGIHYPTPLHELPALAGVEVRGSLDVTDASSPRLLSLPIFPGITIEQQHRVVAALRRQV